MSVQSFDMVVVGAGMVGLAAVKGLLDQGWRVALVEAQTPPVSWPDKEYALRVSAIAPQSSRLLDRLGVWGEIIASGGAPYRHMHVWDENTTAKLVVDAADIGCADLGHIVANRVIQKHLFEAISGYENLVQFCPDECVAFEQYGSGWQVSLSSGAQLQTPLLIAADGARSSVRKHLGIKTESVSYDQSGVVAVVSHQHGHLNTAWQCFLHTGPLAFLPLHDVHQSSIVWTMPKDQAAKWCDCPEEDFNQALGAVFSEHLGAVSVLSKRVAFPLQRHHAEQYALSGAVLIGDAAHSIHPLAGQGVNLGFGDVEALINILAQVKQKSRPLGLLSDLKRFELQRRSENSMMMHFMTALNALFSNQDHCKMRLREQGMNLVNNQRMLKQIFVGRAVG